MPMAMSASRIFKVAMPPVAQVPSRTPWIHSSSGCAASDEFREDRSVAYFARTGHFQDCWDDSGSLFAGSSPLFHNELILISSQEITRAQIRSLVHFLGTLVTLYFLLMYLSTIYLDYYDFFFFFFPLTFFKQAPLA